MNKIQHWIGSSTRLQSILIWLVIYIVGFIQNLWISVEWSIKVGSLNFICLLAIYYTTYHILIPKLLIRGKRILYLISSFALIILFANICARTELYMFEHLVGLESDSEFRFVFSISRYLTIFILTYAIATIIFFSRKTSEDARQKEELLSEKKTLEARVLKSQINSHFIFNALNNIYSMTYFKDKYTSGYVLKLAQMMRYVMEDCETELTPLSKDIEYIENFIDFQKLRFEDDKDITFVYKKEDANVSVPPMIFQPLVENCFKHTPLEVDQNSFIHILLEIKEKQIYFVAENSQPLIKNRSASEGHGIGIENVKRRLELYYENRYTLNIFDDEKSFKVELTINL